MVLGGLSLLPLAAAWALLTGLGLALLAVTAGLGWRIAPIPVIGWKRLALGVGLGVAAITVEPVQSTIMYGQINLVLMGMVALDCLVATPRWPRGVLLGVAAAIKLTPLVFVLVLLLRRQWGAAATALGTFTAAACVGALALPADSRDYWFHTLLDPDRIGILDTATNQGVRGVLERWGISGSGPWLAGCAVVAVLTLVSTSHLVARGDQLGSLLTTAAGALLLSPISWSHHWVWCVPGLIWLARRALVNGGWAWLTAATVDRHLHLGTSPLLPGWSMAHRATVDLVRTAPRRQLRLGGARRPASRLGGRDPGPISVTTTLSSQDQGSPASPRRAPSRLIAFPVIR